MTASEPRPSEPTEKAEGSEERSLLDQALELLVYLPAGVLMTAVEDMPEMAAKGRTRVEQELRNAQVVGRFAVDFGWRQLKEQIDWFAGARRSGKPEATSTAETPSTPRSAPSQRTTPPKRGAASGAPTTARRAVHTSPHPPDDPSSAPVIGAPLTRDPAVDRAIPDYDILSASQVVRRLDGLAPGELGAVVRHERATRCRRAILQHAEQLLGAPGDAAGGSTRGEPDPSRTA